MTLKGANPPPGFRPLAPGLMCLAGARVARDAAVSERIDLAADAGRLRFGVHCDGATAVDLDGFLILPGLINAHDHLEFNLFPRLGRGPYPNATVWAEDIYRPDEPPVREQLRIPKRLRLMWGGIKNLVAGVTSVLHHNPYEAPVFDQGFPVRVIKHFGWAHSLHFSGDVAGAWARTPEDAPFVIHACEGTDLQSAEEINRLDSMGMLGPATVLVHGVGLDGDGIALMRRRGAALIWCPSSNHFTLGRTLSPEVLDSGIPIALGTDSALTAAGDLIDELDLARTFVAPDRLYRMVTDEAARILRLNAGAIRESGAADVVIVRDRGQTPAEALPGLRPEAVLIGGRIKLISEALADRFAPHLPQELQTLEIRDRGRWLIDCDVTTLFGAVKAVLGPDIRLAGREVAA